MKNPVKNELYKIYGLNPDISIATVGKVDEKTVKLITESTTNYKPEAWPPEINSKDRKLAQELGFDVMSCVTETGSNPEDKNWDGGFVKFACYSDKEINKLLLSHLASQPGLAWVKDCHIDLLGFESWYAHEHKDEHYTKVQINIILDNPEEHSILSVSKNKDRNLVAPKRGDVVFLDVTRPHGVIPNQANGIKAMKANPMKALALTIRYYPA